MIGRPMDGRAHAFSIVDFGEYDDIRPTLHLTLLQLLSLFVVLSLLLLVYGLRSLRLKLASLGRLGDKEAWGIKTVAKETEKQETVKLLKDEHRGWWWVDAVVGTDEEERVQVDDRQQQQQHPRLPPSHRFGLGSKSTRWTFQNPLWQSGAHHTQNTLQQQQRQPISPILRQKPPPISMAKLIMSRHAHPPRRSRSPPATSNQQMPQNTTSHAPQHTSRPPSRLSAHVEVKS